MEAYTDANQQNATWARITAPAVLNAWMMPCPTSRSTRNSVQSVSASSWMNGAGNAEINAIRGVRGRRTMRSAQRRRSRGGSGRADRERRGWDAHGHRDRRRGHERDDPPTGSRGSEPSSRRMESPAVVMGTSGPIGPPARGGGKHGAGRIGPREPTGHRYHWTLPGNGQSGKYRT